MQKTLRMLEPVFLAIGVAWAIVITVGAQNVEATWTRFFAVAMLLALGFAPYANVAWVLRSARGRARQALWGVPLARAYRVTAIAAVSVALLASLPAYRGSTSGEPPRSEYRSNTENISFVIPDEWQLADASRLPALPGGYAEAHVALRKAGAACVIAQVAELPRDASREWKQISFAPRVMSETFRFEGNWYVASTTASARYAFSEHDRQYLLGEFRRAISDTDPFILYMSDGTSVPDDCSRDFDTLLTSVAHYYEPTDLTANSSGTLVVDKVWDRSEPDTESYEHLAFIDASGEKREVMHLPEGTSHERFSIAGRKLYVPVNTNTSAPDAAPAYDAAIYEIDPFAKTSKPILGTARRDTYISSVFVEDGTAFYLASSSALARCLDSYRPCPSDLYLIPLAGGTPVFVAHASVGRSILGYVEAEDALYLAQGWGDAGCSSYIFTRVIAGHEEPVGTFGDCYDASAAGQAAYEKMRAAVEAIRTKARGDTVGASAVRVEEGALRPAGYPGLVPVR
jgi:hypothetical protein